MEPKDWGGLLETMYTNFDEKDIPEKIVKLKNKVQSLLNMKSEEFMKEIKIISEEERNYLNSPVLDSLYDTYKNALLFHLNIPFQNSLNFILNSKLFTGLYLSWKNDFGTYNPSFVVMRNFIENPTEEQFFSFSIYIEKGNKMEQEQRFLPRDAFDQTGKVKDKYLCLLDHNFYVSNKLHKAYGKTVLNKIIEAKLYHT